LWSLESGSASRAKITVPAEIVKLAGAGAFAGALAEGGRSCEWRFGAGAVLDP
jgi:hypothetical protein